jgi:hypothetical protein
MLLILTVIKGSRIDSLPCNGDMETTHGPSGGMVARADSGLPVTATSRHKYTTTALSTVARSGREARSILSSHSKPGVGIEEVSASETKKGPDLRPVPLKLSIPYGVIVRKNCIPVVLFNWSGETRQLRSSTGP